MHVFLSWSGPKSQEVATALSTWIPRVIQAAEPWISCDIKKGSSWNKEVSDKLKTSKIGIICLTPDNLDAPWLCFEAGALSNVKGGHVCTFLLDVEPAHVKQPLGQFQHTSFEKTDIYKLVSVINVKVREAGKKPLKDRALEESFETFWPHLERSLHEIVNGAPSTKTPSRPPAEDRLKERLERREFLRSQEISRNPQPARGEDGTAQSYVIQPTGLAAAARPQAIAAGLIRGQPRVGLATSAVVNREPQAIASFLPRAEALDGRSLAAHVKTVRR